MSMEISNTYGNYGAAANSKTIQKESAANETKQYSNANEYAKYLSEKYAYFRKTASVYGVPTTITVSSAYLQKCADDPKEAEILERNLAAVPECTKQGEARLKMAPGSPVTTYRNVFIDENGRISSVSGCTNDPDGKIARENAEKKAQEMKEKEEKLADKRAEKKKQEEWLAEKIAEKKAEHTIMVDGDDIWSMTEKIAAAVSHTAVSAKASLDIKA